jgi:hypothetical protein
MDPDQLLSIRNFGPRSLTELREKLAEYGYLPEGDIVTFTESGDYLNALEGAADGDDLLGSFAGGDEVAEAIASLRGDDVAVANSAGAGEDEER